MDQAVSILTSIYDVYKTIKDGQDQFAATYTRMKDLLNQFQAMQDSDTLVQSRLLDKYVVIARDFLKYLDKYKKRKFLSKVIHQSEMLAEIDGFNQELEALFQLYHLAMGSHIVEHSKAQKDSMDELVRGMRILLQGAGGGHALKTEQSSDDLLAGVDSGASTGPIAKAQADGDLQTLLSLLAEGGAQAEQAAFALYEVAEDETMRDTIVQANAVPVLLDVLKTAASGNATRIRAARTLRRLAVRDVHEVLIVEAGAVEVLNRMLESSESSEDETTAACAALANLAFQAEHKLIMLNTTNLIANLVKLLRSGSASQKKHAANTVRELASNDECSAAIEAAGGITTLVDLLHIGTPELCASALSALWNLASLEKNRTEIAAVGGVNAVVAQIRRGATDDQRQLAASALAVLAQDDANDTLIGSAGGVELLVTLLQTGTDGQKNSAAWALAELANDKDNASAMLRAGVAPALIAAFRSGSDIQRAKAGLALVWIAELADDIPTLVDEVGPSGIVSLLRGSADQRQHAASILACMAALEEYQTKLGELGAIPLLIDLAKNHTPKAAAMNALRALASNNEVNQTKIGEAGGISTIVGVLSMMKHGDTECQNGLTEALEALAAVAETTELRIQVVDCGGIPMLITAMKEGHAELKQVATQLLSDLVEEVPDDDESSLISECVHAFVTALSLNDDDDDDFLSIVLEGLMEVTDREDGCKILVEKHDGVRLTMDLASQVKSDEMKKFVGLVLARIASYEEYRIGIADAGGLEFFNTSLSSKDEDVQSMAIYGLSQLSSCLKLCDRIAETRGLNRRIVKLLSTALTDDAKERTAETISNLARNEDIASELCQIHGLDELAVYVEEGTDLQVVHATCAMSNLSCFPDNVEVLTEIGAIDAAVNAFENGNDEVQLAALELLKNMSANHEAGVKMIDCGVVATCIAAIQSETKQWRILGLDVLVNINIQEDAESESESDSEDENEDSDGYSDDDGDGDDDDDDDDDDEDEDDDEGSESVEAQVVEAGGVDSLLELLEELEIGDRVGLLCLLGEIAKEDEPSKRKIGGSMRLLVEILRDGTDEEQIQSLDTIGYVVRESKRNAAAAIRARVVEAVIKMLGTNPNHDDLFTYTDDLVGEFRRIKSTECATAVKKLVEHLLTVAVTDSAEQGEFALKLLKQMLKYSGYTKTFVDVGAIKLAVDVLEQLVKAGEPTRTSPMEHAAWILRRISDTKFCAKLVDEGVAGLLLALVVDAPGETKTDIARILEKIAEHDSNQVEVFGSSENFHVFVDMVREGSIQEKAAGAGILSLVLDDDVSVMDDVPYTELLDACASMIASKDEVIRSKGMGLIVSFTQDEDAINDIVKHKSLLKLTVQLIKDTKFDSTSTAIDAAVRMAVEPAAQSFLASARLHPRLKELKSNYGDDDELMESVSELCKILFAPAA